MNNQKLNISNAVMRMLFRIIFILNKIIGGTRLVHWLCIWHTHPVESILI